MALSRATRRQAFFDALNRLRRRLAWRVRCRCKIASLNPLGANSISNVADGDVSVRLRTVSPPLHLPSLTNEATLARLNDSHCEKWRGAAPNHSSESPGWRGDMRVYRHYHGAGFSTKLRDNSVAQYLAAGRSPFDARLRGDTGQHMVRRRACPSEILLSPMHRRHFIVWLPILFCSRFILRHFLCRKSWSADQLASPSALQAVLETPAGLTGSVLC